MIFYLIFFLVHKKDKFGKNLKRAAAVAESGEVSHIRSEPLAMLALEHLIRWFACANHVCKTRSTFHYLHSMCCAKENV